MFFHVILTTECNLQCKYCYGEALKDTDAEFPDFEVDYCLPKKTSYNLNLLKDFCRQDPSCVLIFYGGEPLLAVDEIKLIMDNVKAEHFIIQTNGLLLDRLEPSYVNRLHTILVSIDGDECLTDSYRGKGTFRKIVNNLRLVRQNGFRGELIARMTVMEETDVFQQVKWLLDNDEFTFSSVHWQLNAGFWEKDFAERDFEKWSEKNYNPGIRRLVEFWTDQMDNKRTVLRLYPFLGIAQSLLSGEKMCGLRCGGGWANYAVQTDGCIIPCPTMWGMKNYYLGHVGHSNPLSLRRVFVDEFCRECDIFGVCGGRCLYANITKRWNKESYRLVCNTVRNLVDSVNKVLPKMRKFVDDGKISINDFDFLKYNGCEIIP